MVLPLRHAKYKITPPPPRSSAVSGAIPESLGQLHSLEELFLHGNRLTGEIPPSLGNLKSLRKLFLNSNDLVGTVPPELGRLSSLDTLNLSWNNLHGEVPASVKNLVSGRKNRRWRGESGCCTLVFIPSLGSLSVSGC